MKVLNALKDDQISLQLKEQNEGAYELALLNRTSIVCNKSSDLKHQLKLRFKELLNEEQNEETDFLNLSKKYSRALNAYEKIKGNKASEEMVQILSIKKRLKKKFIVEGDKFEQRAKKMQNIKELLMKLQ